LENGVAPMKMNGVPDVIVQMRENVEMSLNLLPPEILSIIFSYLDVASRLNLRLANKSLRRIWNKDKFIVHFEEEEQERTKSKVPFHLSHWMKKYPTL
ncbi:hypothetical protein PFISCL1PPCAC_18921, partial [Pristionchus fissidentatus]